MSHTNLNDTCHEQWQQWNSLHTIINGEWPQRCMATINLLSVQNHMHENVSPSVYPALLLHFYLPESL